MNIYMDLSVLLLGSMGLTSLFFAKTILNIEIKKISYLFIFIINSIFILLIYTLSFISLIIIVFINGIYIKIIFKDKYKSAFILFFFCYFGLEIVLYLFSNGLTFKNYLIVITKPRGILYALIVPIFFLALICATIFVDKVYRLGNYKVNAIIQKNDKKALFNAYFDTGNTLKYDGVPVVFCIEENWILDKEELIDIEVSTINGNSILKGVKALLRIIDSKESYFVYVAFVSSMNSFHGCELLLNAYLSI